jgi:adenylosuccinate lyase
MVLPGRTHGQHAVPATYGLKVATWIDELIRHQERLRQLAPRLFVAMLGGGAGTVASFGAHGLEVQSAMARRLGLGSMEAPSRAQGDRQAELVSILAMLAATQSKIAREVFTGMAQEFGEVEEPVPPGTVGSSTMPQKRNPFLSQDVIAGAAEIRALVPLALEGMQFEGEADRKYSLMLRRAMMQACGLSGDILARTLMIVSGLTLKPERMRANLDLGGGLIMAEPVMLTLGAHIGRQEAHDVVYEAAQASVVEGKPFALLLAADARVTAHLSPAAIEELLDPAAYTGMSAELARSHAVRAREIAVELAREAA